MFLPSAKKYGVDGWKSIWHLIYSPHQCDNETGDVSDQAGLASGSRVNFAQATGTYHMRWMWPNRYDCRHLFYNSNERINDDTDDVWSHLSYWRRIFAYNVCSCWLVLLRNMNIRARWRHTAHGLCIAGRRWWRWHKAVWWWSSVLTHLILKWKRNGISYHMLFC